MLRDMHTGKIHTIVPYENALSRFRPKIRLALFTSDPNMPALASTFKLAIRQMVSNLLYKQSGLVVNKNGLE
ncbi:hypothetical protein BpHYR1_021726 [Brachionus plicatilis]|uniref:Uncharacterized protein n=1 Tax=Brachionus plicatilis TaxID=10195 RepID=A0A3M7PYK7_BRAPC|nr:hypothetical protein BpHYR1_021726 [Brachionus plicatilis]